jgi:hypothetical protein
MDKFGDAVAVPPLLWDSRSVHSYEKKGLQA